VNNVAIIEGASPAYSRITATWGSGPAPDHLKFACELCGTLASHLQQSGCKCTPAQPHPKFRGGIFDVFLGKKRFCISVGAERKEEAMAEIIVWAEPHIPFLSVIYPPINNTWIRWNKKAWNEFGLHLHKAVELQFRGCPLKWMTEDEWLAETPEWHFGD
jgi:hypothetical protein